jgi:hypothetical protein
MKTTLKASILTAVTFVLFSFGSNAQTTQSHTVSMTLSNVLELTLATAGNVDLAFTTTSHYDNGVTGTKVLNVKSNKNYIITAYASGDLIGGGAIDIPLNKLTFKADGGSYMAISAVQASPSALVPSQAATGTGSHTITYFAQPGYAYPAGTYTTTITYTASQP